MRSDIHPESKKVAVTCSCGNKFEVQSVYSEDKMHVEICSACHPFFTGTQKIIEAAGQVDKFRRRYGGRVDKDAAAE